MQINFVVSHMTVLSFTNVFSNTAGRTEDNAVMYEKTHAVLFASNEYRRSISRGTCQQTVPSSSTKGTRPVWPNFPTNNQVHPHSWQQITDQPHDMKLTKTNHGYKPEHKYTHVHVPKSTKQNILIQTGPAQHMSCSPGQVLHLWRAHSPPNPSLMRKLIQSSEARSRPVAWLHNTEWIARGLPREKYGVAQPDIEMLYPPARSVT